MIDPSSVVTRTLELLAVDSPPAHAVLAATRRDLRIVIQALVEAINRELYDLRTVEVWRKWPDYPDYGSGSLLTAAEAMAEAGPGVTVNSVDALLCGHPAACEEGILPRRCRWCEDIARLTKALRVAEKGGRKVVV